VNAIRIFAIALTVVASTTCSRPRDRTLLPPIGRQLSKVPLEPDSRYPSGQPGTGFGDICSILLQDRTTGVEYLLVRSSIARATSNTAVGDSGAVLIAVGEYAPRSADTLSGPPKGQFHVDCLKAEVIKTSSLLAPNTRQAAKRSNEAR
jgi:hypothetical protein